MGRTEMDCGRAVGLAEGSGSKRRDNCGCCVFYWRSRRADSKSGMGLSRNDAALIRVSLEYDQSGNRPASILRRAFRFWG